MGGIQDYIAQFEKMTPEQAAAHDAEIERMEREQAAADRIHCRYLLYSLDFTNFPVSNNLNLLEVFFLSIL